MNMNAADTFRAGANHIMRVRELAKNQQIAWTPADLSKVEQDQIKHPERSIRAFSGVGGGYTIHVMQGNTSDKGVAHMGAITAPTPPQIVHLPPAIAAELYRAAAASQN